MRGVWWACVLLASGCVAQSKYAELETQYEQCRNKLSKQRDRSGPPAWVAQLQPLVDRGVLEVEDVDGRTVIGMSSEVLFRSGSAELSADGTRTVRDLAAVLAKQTDADWQVEGHTDDQPISSQQFPSNWDLGAARAIAVLQVMVGAGMSADHLSAATFGEFAPVAPNTSESGRAKNRRIDVVLLPEVRSRRLQKG